MLINILTCNRCKIAIITRLHSQPVAAHRPHLGSVCNKRKVAKVAEADTLPKALIMTGERKQHGNSDHHDEGGWGVGGAERRCLYIWGRSCDFTLGNRNNTGRLSRGPTYRLASAPVKFLRKLDPAQLTVQALVNGASQTSRCLSFPFCSPLFPIKQCVEWVSEGGEKSYISANCQFFFFLFSFFYSRARFVVILESVCMYGRCPFASARDAQDGGLRVPVMQHAQ